MSADEITPGGIDLSATLAILRRRWMLIVGCVAVALIVSITYLNLAHYRYAVQMRVAPVALASGDGLSSKLSQFGGLAAAAGLSLPDAGGAGTFKLFVEALHSRDVANIMARDPKIMHGVFAREWDARTRTWQQPHGLVYNFAGAIKPILGVPPRLFAPPGSARLQKWLADEIAVDQNLKTPVVTITLMSEDPVFAIQFLDRLGTTIDAMLRERALSRTDDYIRYLTARLPTITLAEQRLAIFQALGEQERLKVAMSSNSPYAADLFEHPAASDRPVSPVPVKVLAIALLLGLVAGVALAFLWPRRRLLANNES